MQKNVFTWLTNSQEIVPSCCRWSLKFRHPVCSQKPCLVHLCGKFFASFLPFLILLLIQYLLKKQGNIRRSPKLRLPSTTGFTNWWQTRNSSVSHRLLFLDLPCYTVLMISHLLHSHFLLYLLILLPPT